MSAVAAEDAVVLALVVRAALARRSSGAGGGGTSELLEEAMAFMRKDLNERSLKVRIKARRGQREHVASSYKMSKQ